MGDIKTLLQLNADAAARDLVFVTTISAGISAAVDAAMATETGYAITYDINAQLLSCSGPFQGTRIKNTIIQKLQTNGYRAFLGPNNVNYEVLFITWTVAGLPSITIV